MLKYSKDGKVCFNSDNHTYFIGDKQLTGATTYISRYKNKFDSDSIAEKFAKKNGLIKEDVLLKWKQEAELSIKNGQACHSLIENYILNGKIQLLGVCEKEKVAKKFIEDYFLTEKLTPIGCEEIVYNETIASQIDCIVKNKKGEFFIIDWKTNKKIDTDSWGKFMLPPYNSTPDCSFYHYSLQLSLYKDMYNENEIKDCYIVHLDNENYKIIKYLPIKLAVI